ncbi:hypothetical protein [Nocardia sp. NPDC003345]
MSLASFNIVLVGENFPIANIKASDFTFNFRQMKEILRVPVALQAEDRNVRMQIIPDRFEAGVNEPQNPMVDANRLSTMVETVFEYVGPKSIKAVGHNVQYFIEGTEEFKRELSKSLLSDRLVHNSLNLSLASADVYLYFYTSNGQKGRLAYLTETENPRTVLDFNINYDVSKEGNARQAIANLQNSISEIEEIALRAGKLLDSEQVT